MKPFVKIFTFVFLPCLVLLILLEVFRRDLLALEVPWLTMDREVLLDRSHKVFLTGLWLAVVLVVHSAVSLVLSSDYRSKRGRGELPGLVRDLIRLSVLLILLALVLNWIWGGFVTPLLGALGIGGIVLGFALQDTLSNFFAGLSLLAEQPFRLGDWIRIGTGVEGRVERMSWRAVQLRTRNEDLLIFPNNVVAKESINNFRQPTRVEAVRIRVGASYKDAPDLVKRALLEVAASVPEVLAEPAPAVLLLGYGDFSIDYELKCFIDDYDRRPAIEDKLRHRIWYAFRRHEIEIPFPIRTVHMHHVTPPAASVDGGADPHERERRRLADLLRGVAIFSALSEEELARLAERARFLEFTAGETIIRQGDPGDTLYVVASGRVRISLRVEAGVDRKLAELGANDFFGEMSLLTGEPRAATVTADTACVLSAVTKSALLPIVAANPKLAEPMAAVAAERRKGVEDVRSTAFLAKGTPSTRIVRQGIVDRMRAFFGL